MQNAIRVLICHKDVDYLNKLTKYLTMTFIGEMILTGVNDMDKLYQLYNKGYKADVVLIDSALQRECELAVQNYRILNCFLIADNMQGIKDRFISKYMAPREMGEFLLNQMIPVQEQEQMYEVQSVGVLATGGGAGCSLLASCLARYKSNVDYPTALMSFNSFYPYAGEVDTHTHSFDVPYMSLKLHSEDFKQGLKNVLFTSAGVSYIPPLSELGDEVNLGREEFKKLLDALDSEGRGYVVFDMGTRWTKYTPDYLDLVDKIVLIIKGDEIERNKTKTFFKCLQEDKYFNFNEFMKKTVVVCNGLSSKEFNKDYPDLLFRGVLEMKQINQGVICEELADEIYRL